MKAIKINKSDPFFLKIINSNTIQDTLSHTQFCVFFINLNKRGTGFPAPLLFSKEMKTI
jgi:hypothetical protein